MRANEDRCMRRASFRKKLLAQTWNVRRAKHWKLEGDSESDGAPEMVNDFDTPAPPEEKESELETTLRRNSLTLLYCCLLCEAIKARMGGRLSRNLQSREAAPPLLCLLLLRRFGRAALLWEV